MVWLLFSFSSFCFIYFFFFIIVNFWSILLTMLGSQTRSWRHLVMQRLPEMITQGVRVCYFEGKVVYFFFFLIFLLLLFAQLWCWHAPHTHTYIIEMPSHWAFASVYTIAHRLSYWMMFTCVFQYVSWNKYQHLWGQIYVSFSIEISNGWKSTILSLIMAGNMKLSPSL